MLTKTDPTEAPIQRRIDAILFLITIAIIVFIASSSAKAAGGSWSIADAETPYPANPFERSAFGDDWGILSNDVFFGGASNLFGLSPASRRLLLTPATESGTKSESNAIVNAASSGENLFSFTGSTSLPFTLSGGETAPNAPSAITAISAWTGGGGNNLWSTGANWGGTAPPTGGIDTDLLFDNSTQLSNSSGGNSYKLSDLTFGPSAGAFVISGTGKLIFEEATGSITSSSGSLQTINVSGMEIKFAMTIGGSGNISIGSLIESSGSITKTGAGTLTLSGQNTYTGTTTISEGTLSANDISGTGSIGNSSTAVILGSASTAGTLSYTGAATTYTRGFTVSAGGGGITNAGSGLLTIGTGAIANGGPLNFNPTTNGITVSSAITGSGSVTKTGAGTLTLNGLNTYTGTTTISEGTLSANKIVVSSSNSSLGNATSAVVLGNASTAGTLSYTGGAATYTRGFTVNAGGGGITNAGTGLLTIGTGAIANGGPLTFIPNANGITVSSAISGGGSVIQSGPGTLTLSGTNNYGGGTTVSAGLLQLNSNSALGSTSGSLTVNGGVLNLNDRNVTVGNLTGSGGTIWNNLATQAVTLTIGSGDNGGGNYAGVIADRNIGGGTGTGTLALTKTGTGTITLSGINTYTGATTVNGGTLLVNGSTASGSAVFVNNSGTLGGSGTVSGTVQVNSGGTLAMGTSPGTLTTGAVTLANGSTFAVDLTAGSGNDLLVTPSFTLGTILTGPSLSLNITGTLATGQQFFIVNNTGANAVSGVFAQGGTITSGGYTFLINYFADFGTNSAAGGNDVMLEVAAPIPEPSTWIGGALALGVLGWAQRRRFVSLLARRA